MVSKYNVPFLKKDKLNKNTYLNYYYVEDLSILIDDRNYICLKKF